MSYRIAAPDEYLAITGMGVGEKKKVKITKAAWVMPFQRCMRFSVQPDDYIMDLKAMTKEKLQFMLPVVFTVGPDVNQRGANSDASEQLVGDEPHLEDKGDALIKFAMLLADSSGSKHDGKKHLESIVKGIIEGEVRVLVSSMTIEEIFTEREEFKKRISKNIQSELDQFGLKIYNSNIKELQDAPDSNYFKSLSQKAHEGATNQARIDVAEAQQKGNVGEAKRRGEQEREIAKINADTQVQKTERDIERATAEASLHTRQAGLQKDVDIARAEAKRALESKDEDLKRDVEKKRAAAEIERLRARDVVQATIAREVKQQAADAEAYEIEAKAKAVFEKAQREADASAYRLKAEADASAWAAAKQAEADLVRTQKEAEGIAAMAEAYGKMARAFGGPQGLLNYMMIEKGTYQQLAAANAKAVQGMQPKISVWNTGSDAGTGGGSGSGAAVNQMRNVYQMLPPLMETIHDQTGITLPEWQFGRLPAQTAAIEGEMQVNGGKRTYSKPPVQSLE